MCVHQHKWCFFSVWVWCKWDAAICGCYARWSSQAEPLTGAALSSGQLSLPFSIFNLSFLSPIFLCQNTVLMRFVFACIHISAFSYNALRLAVYYYLFWHLCVSKRCLWYLVHRKQHIVLCMYCIKSLTSDSSFETHVPLRNSLLDPSYCYCKNSALIFVLLSMPQLSCNQIHSFSSISAV